MALTAAVASSGLTNAALAHRVNELGWSTHAVRLGHDKSSVSHRLRGRVPHPPTPELVAAALSERLGHDVTVDDLGLRRASHRIEPDGGLAVADTPLGTARAVAALTGHDMRRRDFLVGSGFTAAAFAQPALYALTSGSTPVAARARGRRIGLSDVDAIRATTAHFRRLDQTHGGAHLRVQAVRILHEEVDRAGAAAYSGPTGAALFGALAELTCLAGYMTFDAGRHALAQRYYVQALTLARQAGDCTFTAVALSCMSFQATYLGRGRDGVALAAAARQHVERTGDDRAVAMMIALAARGHAVLGDRPEASTALRDAERHLDRADHLGSTPWLAYFSSAELAAHTATCLRDLGDTAAVEPHTRAALAGYDPSCVRSRGFATPCSRRHGSAATAPMWREPASKRTLRSTSPVRCGRRACPNTSPPSSDRCSRTGTNRSHAASSNGP